MSSTQLAGLMTIWLQQHVSPESVEALPRRLATRGYSLHSSDPLPVGGWNLSEIPPHAGRKFVYAGHERPCGQRRRTRYPRHVSSVEKRASSSARAQG